MHNPFRGNQQPLRERPITIESVNNGVDYLYDQAAVDAFGKIYGTASFSDVESPNILKQKGQEQVEAQKNLVVSIELTAVDLKDLGYDVKEIAVGDFIPVVSRPHGINSYMQVSKKSQNLKKPEDSSIVLGSTIKTLVENPKHLQFRNTECYSCCKHRCKYSKQRRKYRGASEGGNGCNYKQDHGP